MAELLNPPSAEASGEYAAEFETPRGAFETGALVRSLYAEIKAIAAGQLADQWAINSLHPTALGERPPQPPLHALIASRR